MEDWRHTKWLFDNNARIVRGAVDDSRVNEVALRRVDSATDSYLPALLIDIVKESLNTLKLWFILQRAVCYAILSAVAQCVASDLLDYCLLELIEYALMDEYSLKIEANLTRVEEGVKGDLLSHFVNVHVRKNDGWIVSAPAPVISGGSLQGHNGLYVQLQGYPLQSSAGTSHDSFPRGCGTSEADLIDAGMARDPRSEMIIAAERLDHARGKELLRKLHQLKATIGGKRTIQLLATLRWLLYQSRLLTMASQ